jgi:hypothetical protein
MPRGPRGKVTKKKKPGQYRTPCLCGCGSTCPATIAAHGKAILEKMKIESLAHARSCLTGLSRRKPGPSLQGAEDNTPDALTTEYNAPDTHTTEFPTAEDYAGEDTMAVDPPQVNEPGSPPPLAHTWANRIDRQGREDEDLVPEPDSPGSSEDEDDHGNERNDEPNFMSDDEEPLIHTEIPAAEELTADFQIRATRAGMLPLVFSASHHPNFMSSTGAFGPG